jgi:hypothetical protein
LVVEQLAGIETVLLDLDGPLDQHRLHPPAALAERLGRCGFQTSEEEPATDVLVRMGKGDRPSRARSSPASPTCPDCSNAECTQPASQ